MTPVGRQWVTVSAVLLLFAASFLLRWAYIRNTRVDAPVIADARLYVILGLNLAEGRGYTTEVGPQARTGPAQDRPPGYPYFLALLVKTSSTMEAFLNRVLWWQAFLGALTVVVCLFIARQVLPPLWSWTAAILAMFMPHLISFGNYYLTETLFTFLLLGGVLAALLAIRRPSPWSFLAAGAVLGLAMFVRPTIQLLPVVLAPLPFFAFPRPRRFRAFMSAALFLLASYSFYPPWKVWYAAVAGSRADQGSFSRLLFYEGSYPGVVLPIDGWWKAPAERRGMVHRQDPDFGRVVGAGWGEVLSTIWKKAADRPLDYLAWFTLGKQALFWSWNEFHGGDINIYATSYTWYDRSTLMGLTKTVSRALHPILILLMYGSGTLLLFRLHRPSTEEALPLAVLLAVLLYFLLIHWALVPAPRYGVPVRPLAYLMGLLCVRWGIRAFSGGSEKKGGKRAGRGALGTVPKEPSGRF